MQKCDRCGIDTDITIMSMFNTDIICEKCKTKEMEHPRYKLARNAEMEQVRQGNYNYQGIGL